LLGLGFSQNDFEKLTDHFSGGWQMRIALAKMLIAENDLLMMDEPTNHLDIDSLEWLTGFLRTYKGALLLVSHDRRFVNAVTNKTLEIYNTDFSVFNGNFDHYLRAKAERDERVEHEFEQQQKRMKEIQSFIDRFRYKSTKAKQVQSRVKMLERFDKIDLPDFEKGITFRFPEPPKSAQIMYEVKNLTMRFGDNLVLDRIDLRIEKGDKLAFVGPNGAGKSTLSKIIASVLTPTAGEKVPGYNTSVAYFSQEQSEVLDPELDVLETIAMEAGNMTLPQIRALAGSFLFTGDDVFKKVGILSGGEKSRVALALLLLKKANLLIMDEPTNHLDYNSKLVLQKALVNFSGSLVIVSHDVDFLQPIVNKVVEIRRGSFRVFPGTIEYYLLKRGEEMMERNEIAATSRKQEADASSNRKDQKRLEAELRNKRYKATKEINDRIANLESEIEKLEEQIAGLETAMGQPDFFDDAIEAKKKTDSYQNLKETLEKKMDLWGEFQIELEGIISRIE